MFEINVDAKIVWPLRVCFLVVALLLIDLIVDVFLLGYVVGASGTKYLVGETNFFLKIVQYVVGFFVLIYLAVQTKTRT